MPVVAMLLADTLPNLEKHNISGRRANFLDYSYDFV